MSTNIENSGNNANNKVEVTLENLKPKKQKRSKNILVLIFIAFIVPVIAVVAIQNFSFFVKFNQSIDASYTLENISVVCSQDNDGKKIEVIGVPTAKNDKVFLTARETGLNLPTYQRLAINLDLKSDRNTLKKKESGEYYFVNQDRKELPISAIKMVGTVDYKSEYFCEIKNIKSIDLVENFVFQQPENMPIDKVCVAENSNKYLQLEGYLKLPYIMYRFGAFSYYDVNLYVTSKATGVNVLTEILANKDNEIQPNSMKALAEYFTDADLVVYTGLKEEIPYGQKTRLKGVLRYEKKEGKDAICKFGVEIIEKN